MKKFFLLLIVLCLLISCASIEKGPISHSIAVVSTTDMHGRAASIEVATAKEDTSSMPRVATAINNVREKFGDDIIVIDNGDTIQGTLMAQYAINYKMDEINPMVSALSYIGYDVWTMGNHEFNFLPYQRDTQVIFAENNGISCLSGNVTLIEDGVNVHGNKAKAGESYYQPYEIFDFKFEDGLKARVAVIGLGNAANANWDLATNYPNLSFSSLENPKGLLSNEIDKWIDVVKNKEKADIVIVAVHSGLGSADEFSLESQTLMAAEATSGVDLFICGHDHQPNIIVTKNNEGKDVTIVNGGGKALTESVLTIDYTKGKVTGVNIESSLTSLDSVTPDETLSHMMEDWYDETYQWASAPIGTFDYGWNNVKAQAEGKGNNDMILSQTALMDFIHKAQIWCTWQSEGVEGATVSIASPVFGTDSNRNLSFVPSDGDTISILELSKIYRYSNNLLCAVELTGQELYDWMSCVADMYTIKDGKVAMGDGVSIFGLDTFYGVDYVIDPSQESGKKLLKAEINGVDIRTIDSINVALNSYRLSGGYGFAEATGKSEADCFWTASQFLGSDRAPVPTQIGEYVKAMKVVSPSDKVYHGYDSSWKIIE